MGAIIFENKKETVDELLANNKRRHKFHVGQRVTNLVPIQDEYGEKIPAGSELVVVAVAAKVYELKKGLSDRFLASEGMDRRPDFLNVVRAEGDTKSRFRYNQILFRPAIGNGESEK